MSLLVVILLLGPGFTLALPTTSTTTPIINTASGPVQGMTALTTTLSNVPVHTYLGIPYATPPLGPLRFLPPRPVPAWNSTLQALTLPNSCSQPATPGSFPGFEGDEVWYANTPISEDCLYLNIWVPTTLSEDDDLVPVLLWLHGGALLFGTSTSDIFQGDELAAAEGVVVVSTQYRLGPLGFMYLGVDDVPGNVGLLDQVLAMQWIADNIKAFGGDPNRITIFGESAGGASVEYHLLSPLSRSLFNSGIIMSGTYTSRFQPPASALEQSLDLAHNVGCTDPDLDSVIDCLRKVPDTQLVSNQMKDFHKALRSPFVATIDGKFLQDTPLAMLENGHVKRAPILIGDVRNEGTFFMPGSFKKMRDTQEPAFIPYDEMVHQIESLYSDRSPIELDAILQEYTNWTSPDDGYSNQLRVAEAAGDGFLTCPSRKFADGWSSLGLPVYFYWFSHRTSTSPWGEWYGVRHTDEIEYVFGKMTYRHTPEENEFSRAVMHVWAEFARSGKPNGAKWEVYTRARPVYAELNTGKTFRTSSEVYGPRARECAMWNEFIPKLKSKAGGLQGAHQCLEDIAIVI